MCERREKGDHYPAACVVSAKGERSGGEGKEGNPRRDRGISYLVGGWRV